MKLTSVLFAAVAFVPCSCKQSAPSVTIAATPTPPPAEVQPQTKLEQFKAKTGSVIITGSSNVGQIRTTDGGVISVEVREFTDAGSGAKQSGIVIRVQGVQDRSSYVDADEIESLIAGVDYIAKPTKTSTILESSQAHYRTRGSLDVYTFASDGSAIEAVI